MTKTSISPTRKRRQPPTVVEVARVSPNSRPPIAGLAAPSMMHLETAAHLGSPHGPADLDAIPSPASWQQYQCQNPPLPMMFTGVNKKNDDGNNSALPLGVYDMPEIPPLLIHDNTLPLDVHNMNDQDNDNDIALPLDVHYMKDLVSKKKKRPSRAGGVDDLKVLCGQKGLPTNGLKGDLVRWLAAYDAAPTDSIRASAQQSAARDASKIREEKKRSAPQVEQRCKCNVPLRRCKRCWGSGVCDHNELRSACWFCAKESPGEDLPLAERTLGQLRVEYESQGLDEKYCPQAPQGHGYADGSRVRKWRSLPYKSDLLDVLERLASLGETERAARLFDLKALDEKAQKAQASPKSRAPKKGLDMTQKNRVHRKLAAERSQQHAERSDASTGKWTDQEHETFLQGLVSHGVGATYDWKSIQQMVPGRTLIQIRTHAQAHFKKQQ